MNPVAPATLMQVKLDDIPETGLSVDEALPVAFVDDMLPHAQELHAEGPGRAKLRLTRHDDNVLIDGSAEVKMKP